MTLSKASRVVRRTAVIQTVLAVVFTAIFGGITLCAVFISKLNF